MPTTTVTTTLKPGRPETAYSVKGSDLVKVDIQGLSNLPQATKDDTATTKGILAALAKISAKVSGACYRLNVILQQINARIQTIETTIGSGTTTNTTNVSNVTVSGTSTTTITSSYVANFIWPFPGPSGSTSYMHITSPFTGTPYASYISVVTASAIGTILADVQISNDSGASWISIFTTPMAITVNQQFGAPYTGSSNFSGAGFTDGCIVRGFVTAASAAGGIQLSIQVYFK